MEGNHTVFHYKGVIFSRLKGLECPSRVWHGQGFIARINGKRYGKEETLSGAGNEYADQLTLFDGNSSYLQHRHLLLFDLIHIVH